MPPEASEPFIFVLAEVVVWFIGGAAIGIGIGATMDFIRKRANARLAARRAAELDERLARRGVSPDRQKIVRLCECGHGANYHTRREWGCYDYDDAKDRFCRCQQFTPHPPLFDELAEPDAFEDREDPSSTIGRAS